MDPSALLNIPTPLHAQPPLPPQSQGPRLLVLRQTALSEEKFSKNGVVKNIQVVVKNTAFLVQVAIVSSPIPIEGFDFHHLAIDAELVYDTDEAKPVDYVKVKPLEFKSHSNDKGDQCTIEMRIKVLTSQLEDMFFRVRFRVANAATMEPIPGLQVYSEPIKVISKPDQLKKKPMRTKKRNFTELLLETLEGVEDQQSDQLKLLMTLLNQSDMPEPFTNSEIHPEGTIANEHPELTIEDDPPQQPPVDFDLSYFNFLNELNAIPADQRAIRLQQVLKNISPQLASQFPEFMDVLWIEGLKKKQSDNMKDPSGDSVVMQCDDNCPHKRELERIDEFYKEFLSIACPPHSES